jgi:hypothetical protein
MEMWRLRSRKERPGDRPSRDPTALVLRYTLDAAEDAGVGTVPARAEASAVTPSQPQSTDFVVEVERDRGFLWHWSLFELIELGGDDQHAPIAGRSVDPLVTARFPRFSQGAAVRAGERAARALSASNVVAVVTPPESGTLPTSPWPVVALLILVLAGALIVGALVETGGNPHRLKPLRPPTTSSPRTRSGSPSQSHTLRSRSAAELDDEGYSKMRSGDYTGALPLLEQAVARLKGTGTLTEAYAEFNLANTRYHLGKCTDVLALLQRSQQIQGHRGAIGTLQSNARRTCR